MLAVDSYRYREVPDSPHLAMLDLERLPPHLQEALVLLREHELETGAVGPELLSPVARAYFRWRERSCLAC